MELAKVDNSSSSNANFNFPFTEWLLADVHPTPITSADSSSADHSAITHISEIKSLMSFYN